MPSTKGFVVSLKREPLRAYPRRFWVSSGGGDEGMGRWLFVFLAFALMFAVACGLEAVSLVSARVEELAFLVVPAIFMIAAIIGLGMRRHV
jgi:hypothetical protein